LWDSDQLGEAFRFIGDIVPPEAKPRRHSKYVLDGQQRLTSLLFALRPENLHLPEAISSKYEIYFCIDDECFYGKRPDKKKVSPQVNWVRKINSLAFMQKPQRITLLIS